MRDRAFYLDCIKWRAYSKGGIAPDFYKVLDRHDESKRYWLFRAAHQIDAHSAMVACGWDPGHTGWREYSNSKWIAYIALYANYEYLSQDSRLCFVNIQSIAQESR